MSSFQIAFNATTKVATVQAKGDVLPAGSTKIAEFDHDNDLDDPLGPDVNHVTYHHVRDALYRQGELNMQIVTIALDQTYKALTGISATPATKTLAPAATQQITVTFTPADASNQAVSYVSSDEAKATVDNAGLITAVADGEATITVTSVDGGFTDTVVITVQT
jgi:uncharacterized protein YjdB